MQSAHPLIHTLVRCCLAEPSPEWTKQATEVLAAASDAQWRWALAQLNLHRLVEHVFHSLEPHCLTPAVPDSYRLVMAAQFLRSACKSRLLLSGLDALLQAASESGLHPLVMKGIAMADYFYPDPASRPMGDLDLAFSAQEMQRVPEAFARAGFEPCPEKNGGDAIYFANSAGVQCDAHFRQRLFEGKESMQLTAEVVPQHLQSRTMRLYEPSAMMVHLVVHMAGHWPQTGPLLYWIMDLALVLRKWGGLIDPLRLQALMPERSHQLLLGRLLALLRNEFGVAIPESLQSFVCRSNGFTLEQLLRRRRLREWGLPGVKGWGRVLALRLGVALKRPYPPLETRDLLLWITDTVGDTRVALDPDPRKGGLHAGS